MFDHRAARPRPQQESDPPQGSSDPFVNIARTIAHDLDHRIGCMHKPEYDGADSPLVYALGNCVRDAHAQGQALAEFSAELPDSGHGGDVPTVLAS